MFRLGKLSWSISLVLNKVYTRLMDFMPRLESDERIYSHKIRFQAERREYASQGTYTCAIGEN